MYEIELGYYSNNLVNAFEVLDGFWFGVVECFMKRGIRRYLSVAGVAYNDEVPFTF